MGNPIRFKAKELSEIKKKLISKQHGLCPICKGSLIGVASINVVVDHDHSTGIVRAAMHRGCNRAEGMILQALQRYGKAIGRFGAINTLSNVLDFWKEHATPQTEWIYYKHRTEAEKLLLANKRRKKK